ncbi:MAG: AAA family ATPase [Chitinophagales bacterium]
MSRNYKILMLENDENFVKKVRRQLKRSNIEVEQARSEDEVIIKVENGGYDLLTIDFVLNRDGHGNRENIEQEKEKRKGFIKKLRLEKNTMIPILVISSHRETIHRLLDVGANAYIDKNHTRVIPKEILHQIENTIPSLLEKHAFLSKEEEDDIDIQSIDDRIKTLDEIIIAYDRIKLSHYSYPMRYRERKQKLQYKKLLQQKLTIDKIHLSNLVVFKDVSWNPQPNINILLGRNGYGKTFLSRILLSLMCDSNYALDFFGIDTQMHRNNEPQNIQAKIRIKVQGEEKPMDIHQSKAFFNSATPKIPILAIPDVRTFDKARKQLPTDIQEDIVGNSASAYIEKRPFNNTILHLLNLLCGYYRESEIKGTKKHPIFALLEEVYRELIGGEEYFEFVKVGLATKGDNNLYVKSSFTNGEIIKLQDASQGTLSVMVIFGLIYHYLELKNMPPPEENSPSKIQEEESEIKDASKTHGIVFIDEIDSHLHPSWQQKIVPLLRKHFPNVQFFLNSHSSLVVMGCLEKEVCKLQKKDEKIYLEQYSRNFIGFTTPQLYEIVFEIKDEEIDFIDKYRDYLFINKKDIEAVVKKYEIEFESYSLNKEDLIDWKQKERLLKHLKSFENARNYREVQRKKELLLYHLQKSEDWNQLLERKIERIENNHLQDNSHSFDYTTLEEINKYLKITLEENERLSSKFCKEIEDLNKEINRLQIEIENRH